MEYRLFIFQLKHLKGIGNKGLLRILNHYIEHPEEPIDVITFIKIGRVKAVYHSLFQESFIEAFKLTHEDFHYFLDHYSFITIMEEEYPENLIESYNPPIALFYLGNINLLKETNRLAVIGSREASHFGKEMVSIIVPELCQKEICIVSGLAKGNDTFAHQAAIRNHGKTIAVIGSGLNIFYPKENENLQQFIGREQLLLSEYLPGVRPLKYHFPSRNRIIAGISRGTCVIEAKEKSGTFITAQFALDEGRDVFAVPGNPLSKSSEGCLKLIQAGAKCIWKTSDILEEWYLS
ncbi:MAG: DNA-processing protein DprA [Vagococcus sp.]|uniref:DNA-processing protein DprA n=1 Tax=Vagococcus TaxID=2737 RepID=UPI002FC5B3B5